MQTNNENVTTAITSASALVKTLSYPYELEYHELDNSPIELSVISEHKNTTIVKNKSYSFLAKLSNRVKQDNKNRGLIIIDRSELNACNLITARYSFNTRIKSRRHDAPKSCYEYWNTERDSVIRIAIKQLERFKDTYKPEQLPPAPAALENECAKSLLKTGIPGSFPSTIVTCMLDEIVQLSEFKMFAQSAKNNYIRMLDISAGWGDRLLAACSRNIKYVGCDPNSMLVPAYNNIIATHGDCKRQAVICSPFEDNWQPVNNIEKFNFLLSSPPFFNLEIYSDEDTQSSVRYPDIKNWMDKFLKPSLCKCAILLEAGSPVILHLSDVIDFKNPFNSVTFVEEIIQYCTKELGWKFLGNYSFTVRDAEKKSESANERQTKDESKLNPRGVVKTYDDGLRCNKYGDIMSQPLWIFKS